MDKKSNNNMANTLDGLSEEELKGVSGGTMEIEVIPEPGNIDALNQPIDIDLDTSNPAKTREKKGPLHNILR